MKYRHLNWRSAPVLALGIFCLANGGRALAQPVDGSTEWPQWRGATRDGVWRESALLKELPDSLEVRWRAPIGSGYCGPTVAKGRVYVMDRLTEPIEVERIHCFDWKLGKKLWIHEYACSYAGVSYKAGPRCSVLVAQGLAYC